MSPGRRRNAAKAPRERIFIEPSARRQAMLEIIGSARERLVLSLFRCNDYGVLDGIAAALERGVKVEAILTKRAKGGKKNLKKLWEALGEMGAVVHWYADPVVKYHAKYVVADNRQALIATLNPTKKCFTRTWDFVFTTADKDVVRSVSALFALDAAGERILPRHRISNRLVVGPEGARSQIRELILSARTRIQLLDHKLSDPELVALLRERRSAGVEIEILGYKRIGPLVPHGKLLMVDQSRAVLGSMALSALSLDFRREVSVVIEDPVVLSQLSEFYRDLSERAGGPSTRLPGDVRGDGGQRGESLPPPSA
jgi:phosphatidylserine/phosphatidylglycerophosphate/cardiolipin synthase-like enzyme